MSGPQKTAIALIVALHGISASAQWLDYRVPGTPRHADGKPKLSAPAPRTTDGQPDLSGVWAAERNRPPGPLGSGFVGNRHGGNIAADLAGGAPLTAWGRQAFTQPWSATVRFELQPDTELLDHQCENDRWNAATR